MCGKFTKASINYLDVWASSEHTGEEGQIVRLDIVVPDSFTATEGTLFLNLQRVSQWLHSIPLVDLTELLRGGGQGEVIRWCSPALAESSV